MIPWLANHLWQSTLCFLLAALLVRALKRQGARWRYAIWLAASLKFLVPFALLTAIGARLPAATLTSAPGVSVSVAFQAIGEPFGLVQPQPSGAPAPPDASFIRTWLPTSRALESSLLLIWAAGIVLLCVLRAVRSAGLRRLLRASDRLDSGREIEAVDRAKARLRVSISITLLASDSWLEPAVVGILRPAILWPPALTPRLTNEELDAILAHEVLHVRRRDNLAAALHATLKTVFWFHPALWWLEGRLLDERERACDAAVVDLGSEPHAYAAGILKVCNFCLHLPFPSAAGVSGANLKQRVEDIMSARTSSSLGLARRTLLAITAAGLIVAPIAAGSTHAAFRFGTPELPNLGTPELLNLSTPDPRTLAPQSAAGRVTGVVTDQRGDPIQGAEIKLGADPKAPASAATDDAGRYSLDLPPGQYQLQVQKPGFAAFRTTIFVNRGASLQRDAQLRVGSVSEAINVTMTSELARAKAYLQQGRYAEAEAAVDQALAGLRGGRSARAGSAPVDPGGRVVPPPPPPPPPPGPVRVGGEIAAPKKIHDVPPIYPADARAAGVGGIVIIDATITTDGTVRNAQVLRGNPLLNQAALDAVLQWMFTPTLLNGAPVEVQMTVTITFQAQ